MLDATSVGANAVYLFSRCKLSRCSTWVCKMPHDLDNARNSGAPSVGFHVTLVGYLPQREAAAESEPYRRTESISDVDLSSLHASNGRLIPGDAP